MSTNNQMIKQILIKQLFKCIFKYKNIIHFNSSAILSEKTKFERKIRSIKNYF